MEFLDQLKELGFHHATEARHHHRHRRHHHPAGEGATSSPRRSKVVDEIVDQHRKGIITNRERYNKVIDKWTQVTNEVRDRMFEHLADDDAGLQPGLHDERLGRPRFGRPDQAAGRHARPDGQAAEEDHRRFRRDHRAADHRELPRGPDRARVLHLDARRAQGSGRHGAQDRRRRLPDPPPGGRGAGHRDHRARLRHPDAASRSRP